MIHNSFVFYAITTYKYIWSKNVNIEKNRGKETDGF